MTDDQQTALKHPEADWEVLPSMYEFLGKTFVSGGTDADRLQVAAWRRAGDAAAVGRAFFGPGCQGPPGHAHGGSMAALLDEVMGLACWVSGHPVLAKSITIGFKRPLPLGSLVTFEARVVHVEGRLVKTVGELRLADVVVATGEGIFSELGPEKLARIFGGGGGVVTR